MRPLSMVVVSMVVLVACSENRVVNYQVKMTNAPVCPADGDRARGNNLKRVLVVRAETSSKAYAEFTFSGGNRGTGPGDVSATNAQVLLAKSGKQSVKFRFGACPSKEKPSGNTIHFGCEERDITWYAEQQVTLDPKNLVIVGEPGESRAAIEWPWPANELECWTGMAARYPTPL